MKIVVADTGPLNYLILINEIDLLPKLYESIFIPQAVCRELDRPQTPPEVRRWIKNPPDWLSIQDVFADDVPVSLTITSLHAGEAKALKLASILKADLVLIDDRAGVNAARVEGFSVMGTLGILDLAAWQGMVDLADAFSRLRGTNFRCRTEIMEQLLSQHQRH